MSSNIQTIHIQAGKLQCNNYIILENHLCSIIQIINKGERERLFLILDMYNKTIYGKIFEDDDNIRVPRM